MQPYLLYFSPGKFVHKALNNIYRIRNSKILYSIIPGVVSVQHFQSCLKLLSKLNQQVNRPSHETYATKGFFFDFSHSKIFTKDEK